MANTPTTFTFTTPRSTSGLPVTLSITGPGRITSVTTNLVTVTVTGVGNIRITASQGGNNRYRKATDVVYTVRALAPLKSQTITAFGDLTNNSVKLVNDNFTYNLPTASSGLPVTVTVKEGAATVNQVTNTVTKPVEDLITD